MLLQIRRPINKHYQQSLLRTNQHSSNDNFSIRKKGSWHRIHAEAKTSQVERSVNRSIIAVIMVYSIAWFPMIILLVTVTIHNLYDKDIASQLHIAFSWTAIMSYCNGGINPFIYAYICDNTGRDIRAFILNMKRKIFQAEREGSAKYPKSKSFF